MGKNNNREVKREAVDYHRPIVRDNPPSTFVKDVLAMMQDRYPVEEPPDPMDEVREKISQAFPEADAEDINRMLREYDKSQAEKKKAKTDEAFFSADEALKKELPALVAEIAARYSVNFAGYEVVLRVPLGGDPQYRRAPIGKTSPNKKGGSGNGRKGFGAGWGVECIGEGIQYSSPTQMAKALNLKVEGHPTMVEVFEKQGYTTVVDENGERPIKGKSKQFIIKK